jgi:hypothetical protein
MNAERRCLRSDCKYINELVDIQASATDQEGCHLVWYLKAVLQLADVVKRLKAQSTGAPPGVGLVRGVLDCRSKMRRKHWSRCRKVITDQQFHSRFEKWVPNAPTI